MVIDLLNKGMDIDFKNGNILMCKFDDENNIWVNLEEVVIMLDMDYFVFILKDELLINCLKK